MKHDALDPKGLIREAYNIDGISYPECRSIFLDWALSIASDVDTHAAMQALEARHDAPDHPMTQVLREGQAGMTAPRRRGGWRGRQRPN